MDLTSDSILTFVLIGAALLVVGVVIGLLIGKRSSPDQIKQRDMEERLDTLLAEHKAYQNDVSNHFSQTATLVNNLTAAYREVHQHLAKGAGELCDGEGPLPLSQPEPEANPKEIPAELGDIKQPLDYAPKSSPDETGMLNEKFGLDKTTDPGKETKA
ncbi:MAG: hypothetical protein CR978_01120 [Gammaproteobacteria bacterium]|nr:MAG: hypothetical protein CR978_01120 [Gammaproteobacteria bacterium]